MPSLLLTDALLSHKPRKQPLAQTAHSAANTASCSAYETAANVAQNREPFGIFLQAETKTAFETVVLKTLVCGVNFSGSAKSDPNAKSKVSKKISFSQTFFVKMELLPMMEANKVYRLPE